MHPEVRELQSKLKEILYDCAVDLKATKAGSKITLEWKSYVKDSRNLAVYICAANKIKRGDPDDYVKVGEVPVKSGKHSFSFGSNSGFFKIVIKTPAQAANTWLGTPPK